VDTVCVRILHMTEFFESERCSHLRTCLEHDFLCVGRVQLSASIEACHQICTCHHDPRWHRQIFEIWVLPNDVSRRFPIASNLTVQHSVYIQGTRRKLKINPRGQSAIPVIESLFNSSFFGFSGTTISNTLERSEIPFKDDCHCKAGETVRRKLI
jgi:hypothetical protein